ncbi:transposable element Tcb2 transposase [Trichonephila clavipes]|nr:transposable element Tcb2 transposase [Trichonephila clavipes]
MIHFSARQHNTFADHLIDLQTSNNWHGTAIRGFSSGRPRGTTPADDRYIVLQARRNMRQTAGEIARHRRLDDRYRVLPWPEDCTVVVCLHDALYDESRFSLSSDSHRILIWRERGSRNHPSNIIERDRYGGRGVLVWGGIMLGSRTDLHIFDAGSVNGTRYCNEILLPHVRLFRGAMGLQFLFMDDNAPSSHSSCRTALREHMLGSSYLTTSNDSGASIGAARRMGSNASTTH